MVILDTNVISELFRVDPDPAVLRFVHEHDDDLAITSITIHEISYALARLPHGSRRRRLADAFLEFTEALTDPQILELDEPSARRSGQVRAHRAALGAPMDISDAHIAGIAQQTGYPLATRNVKDFAGIGVELIDPWAT
ncbi:MAG: type II toxin-antitoxin system VapC family toxin [Brachybacterium sp.]|nr:type II toxin-antitoxin system VapC family toxin [Brachybacterium sp.]